MDERELNQEIMTVDERVNALVIASKDDYETAGGVMIELNTLEKRITEYWQEPIRKAHEAHKSLTEKRSEMLNPIAARKRLLNGKISTWLTEQEKIRRAEQAKLDEERRQREQAEREKLQRQAEKAAEKGKEEKAEALRQKADEVYVPPSIAQPTVEKTTRMESGTVSSRTDIDVTITDPMEILKGIISGTLPISIVTINESKLKAHVKAFQLKIVAGCVITEKVVAAFRGRS